ncbi:hypothetical protein D3C75_913080 [compost metagenome]
MLPLVGDQPGAVDLNLALRVNADITAATTKGDAIFGCQLQVALTGLHRYVLLGDQVEYIAVGLDFQWPLAGDQAHAFLLGQQGNTLVGLGGQTLGGGQVDFVLALQVERVAAVEQEAGRRYRTDAFGRAEQDGRALQVFCVGLELAQTVNCRRTAMVGLGDILPVGYLLLRALDQSAGGFHGQHIAHGFSLFIGTD